MSTEPQPTDLRVQAEIVSHRGLGLTAETFATGFGPAIHRKPKVQFLALNFASERPRCVSIKPARPKIKTISLEFPVGAAATFLKKKADDPLQPGETKPAVDPHAKKAQDIAPEPSSDEPKRYTRMAPPRDVVKLEDRLYYVLQPPLEAWAAGEQIEFPFRPFPYQFEGIAFLYPRTAALLADEMGLGKTMQTISTMRMLLRSGDVKNILLICPKPLVFNWQREFAAWAPEIPVAVMEGDSAKRKWLWNLPDVPLRIANYELLQRDKDLVLAPDRKFDLVVLDEAQRIKNVNNASAQVARAIQRKRSWAITGTPVENSHEDLVGIFEYLSPGYLQKDMKATRLGQLAGHYVLRRTKDMVLKDMPPKMIRDEYIELSPEQNETYRLAEDKGVIRLAEMGKELTVQHVFELVLRLKQICNFDPPTGESSKVDRLVAEMEEVAASGQKALVFSQWVDSLEILADKMKQFNPLQYHGRVPSPKRAGIIDTFKADKKHSVLLMSYGAGGVGLNLQFATYVFLFDRWWNPAIEDQAINRAHRIGAAGPVTVTRFIAKDTIEQRIDLVLSEKREIFQTIFSESGEPQQLGLSKEEIFGLFKLRCPQGPIDVAA